MRYIVQYLRRVGFGAAGLLFAAFVMAPSAIAVSPGSVGSWKTSPNSLPQTLGGPASVVYGGYVYVMGGSNSLYNTDVYSAKLNSDGSVGTWTTSPNTLPVGVATATAVVNNGYVYVMGGWDGTPQVVDTIYYSKLGANGTLGAWSTETTNPLPQAIGYAGSVIYNHKVYVIGGEDSGSANLSTVYYDTFNSNGSLGTWQTATNSLPQGVSALTAVENNGYIYSLGGFAFGNIIDNVYYAKINSDGSVGAWTDDTANPLPQPVEFEATASNDNYIYSFGGYGNPTVVSSAYYAKLNSNGAIASWTTSPNPLPAAEAHAAYAQYNNYAYVLGGSGASGSPTYDTVYYAQLTGNPIVMASPTTSSSTPMVAPDTGFGAPGKSGPVMQVIASVSIVSVGLGLLNVYRQQQSS